MRQKIRLYLYNLLIGIDQLANTLLGGAPDRTISYRAYQHSHHKGWNAIRIGIDWIFKTFFGQKNHCQQVYEGGDVHLQEVVR